MESGQAGVRTRRIGNTFADGKLVESEHGIQVVPSVPCWRMQSGGFAARDSGSSSARDQLDIEVSLGETNRLFLRIGNCAERSSQPFHLPSADKLLVLLLDCVNRFVNLKQVL